MIRLKLLFLFWGVLFVVGPLRAAVDTIFLTDTLEELWVVREYVEVFVDTSCALGVEEVDRLYKKEVGFFPSKAEDLVNSDVSSAYWLRFRIEDQRDKNKEFCIEVYDHDIEEITFFVPALSGGYKQYESGAGKAFDTRQLGHKNVNFLIPDLDSGNNVFYMRFYSGRINVLEPSIKALTRAFNYSIHEYLYIGLFYGALILIISYNLVYYLILRRSFYWYYLVYIASTLLYLSYNDGVGFQFLWFNHPEYTAYIPIFCLTIASISMCLFCCKFLDVPEDSTMYKIVKVAIAVRLTVFFFQVFVFNSSSFLLVDYLYAQVIYALGWYFFMNKKTTATKWFVLSYSFLNAAITISLLEKMLVVTSGVFTVYSVNIGILIQFVLLTIGMAETVKDVYKSKINSDKMLIEEYKRNEILKEKVNKELESKVIKRTKELHEAKEAVEQQSEKIKLMNRDLDLANFKLRQNLSSFAKETVNKSVLDFEEFKNAYPNDLACKRFLMDLKAKRGFLCKRCGSTKSIRGKSDYDVRCGSCDYNESLTANTIFHRSRFSLLQGFYMLYCYSHPGKKVTAVDLSEKLELNVATCQRFNQKVQEKKERKIDKNSSWEKLILN